MEIRSRRRPRGKVAADSSQHAEAPGGELWDAIYLRGKKVGYGHTKITFVEEAGRRLRRIEYECQLAINRFSDSSTPALRFVSVETPEGRLVRYESTTQLSAKPTKAEGRVADAKLQIEKTTVGKTERSTLPCPEDLQGANAIDDSLRRKPMQPGETRTLKRLEPFHNAIVTDRLTARRVEPTKLPGQTVKLLLIDQVTALPGGQELTQEIWTDNSGQILKASSKDSGFTQETYRVSKQQALAVSKEGAFDIGEASTIPVARPIPRPHQTRQIRYRVRLEDDNPAKVFPSGPSQQVTPVDEHTAEIVVRAIRPPERNAGPQPAPVDPPGADDSKSNGLIQSDNPRVMAMAASVAPREQDPWKVAVALERLVKQSMTEVNFSSALASAAEVCETLKGDCTEHAVLLAALARRGAFPRVALGLVYSPGLGGFAFHMWTEVYVAGGWYPLDATLGQGGLGAAHLKLTSTNLKGAEGLASFLPVAKVLGRLKIDVIEIK